MGPQVHHAAELCGQRTVLFHVVRTHCVFIYVTLCAQFFLLEELRAKSTPNGGGNKAGALGAADILPPHELSTWLLTAGVIGCVCAMTALPGPNGRPGTERSGGRAGAPGKLVRNFLVAGNSNHEGHEEYDGHETKGFLIPSS